VRAFATTVKGIKSTPRASPLNPPTFFDNKERIIYAVTWATSNEVSPRVADKKFDLCANHLRRNLVSPRVAEKKILYMRESVFDRLSSSK
jgi:hypothetical protein